MNTQLPNTAYQISYNVMEQLTEELTKSCGNINTEIEEGDMLVVFEGWYSVDGTYEEETNYHYLTSASVSLTCTAYNEEGDEVANDYTDKKFEEFLLN